MKMKAFGPRGDRASLPPPLPPDLPMLTSFILYLFLVDVPILRGYCHADCERKTDCSRAPDESDD